MNDSFQALYHFRSFECIHGHILPQCQREPNFIFNILNESENASLSLSNTNKYQRFYFISKLIIVLKIELHFPATTCTLICFLSKHVIKLGVRINQRMKSVTVCSKHCRCHSLNLSSSVSKNKCQTACSTALLPSTKTNDCANHSQRMKVLCVIKRFAME